MRKKKKGEDRETDRGRGGRHEEWTRGERRRGRKREKKERGIEGKRDREKERA